MSYSEAGKGSKQRPKNVLQFEENYGKIFGKSKLELKIEREKKYDSRDNIDKQK